MYPFVHGFTQTGDQVTHLAQLNAPYTQAGWNNRVISDVIDGEWSLKQHAAVTGLVYYTIPQNFRFEAILHRHPIWRQQPGMKHSM